MTVHTEWKMFSGKTGDCRAYFASMEPVAEPRPAVLIIQEIWGVDAHIRDVAGRFAAAGYVAIAPELFAVNGVTPEPHTEERLAEAKAFLHSIPHSAWFNPRERETAILGQPADRQDRLRETLDLLFGLLNPAAQSGRLAGILADTAEYARNTYEKTKGMPVASVGFCMGGALSAVLATRDPLHAGSVVFYGRPPQEGIADIQCPVLGFYGGQDPNITNLIPGFQEEMKKHGKAFEAVVYPDAKHAFYNDTNPTYDVNSARDAFARSLVFLNRVVGQ
ncbi:dienelactone hydrolase family protein [Ferviditalea candida]|uniref:Dienelactone hydrolase family protein n=1 Tax=Ferviditalea candida TaxID=3108399 RepID=A0ABU5ZLX5_9BACL|nr:dienelactone hydrolase family protein [Paenibacillaceae bacterium T2]